MLSGTMFAPLMTYVVIFFELAGVAVAARLRRLAEGRLDSRMMLPAVRTRGTTV